MKTFLLIAGMIMSGSAAFAQAPTIVTEANNCTVFRNFNLSDEGFSSPSIYSDNDDVQFSWNAALGAEVESSGLVVRNGSLISPAYILNVNGQVTVGFQYSAPVGTEYRIRIISGANTPPLEILATTGNGPEYTALPATSGSICLLLSDADLTVGREIRFEIVFRVFLPGNVIFDNLAASVEGGPLPVTFEGFVAKKNADGTAKLLWDVGTEINVKGYYVETSSNGVDFTEAGYVTAAGKDIYSFDYMQKMLQTTFFRVKSMDFDGRAKYTVIIKVYAKDQTTSQILVYPVPARDQVTIQHLKSSSNTRITLVNPDGKVVQQVIALPNSLQTQLNISNLQQGLYFIRYDDGQGEVQVAKLIKN
jgi:hypothetical protein